MIARAGREAVFAALFARLQAVAGLTTVSRKMRAINELRPEEFNAAFQLQGPQHASFKGDVPTKTVLSAMWAIYTFTDDQTVAPSTALNNLVDACCAVLAPSVGFDRQTLGGLVELVAVDGEIEVYEGLLGSQAAALIPIKLLLPGF